MNRKWTALLLAMTFILSTVAPTMATAETGKTGSEKTAAVSVEKPKKEKSKFAALVDKLIGVKEAISGEKKETPLKETGTESTDPAKEPTDGKDKQNEDHGTSEAVKVEISFIVKDDTKGTEGTEAVTGAKLRILKGDKEVEKPWDSEKNPKEFSLEPGVYKLEMTEALKGYKKADPIKFEVTDKGEIKGIDSAELKELETKEGKKVLVMKVEKEPEKEAEKIYFSLRDADNKELTAAKLTITSEDASKPAIVLSGDRALKVGVLDKGKFKLTAEALAGYKIKDNPIEFEITAEGKIKDDNKFLKTEEGKQTLIMKAEREAGKTFFGMKDSVGRNVAGATLQIRERKSGRPVENATWASEKGMVPIALKAGEYELVQVDGPAKGYTMAAPIAFDINDNGEIYGLSKDEHGDQYLALRVDPLENKTFFSLKDNRGNEIAGVKLQIKEVGTEQVVKEWESGKSPVDIKLEAGEYEFSQINVLPGYLTASPIRFKVADGKIIEPNKGLSAVGGQQVLSLVDGYVKHGIKFRRVKADGKDLADVIIEIYKDGTKIAYWKSGSEANALELEPGVYRYHEAGISDGHKKVADFEFEVKTDGTISLGTVQVGDTVKLKDSTIIVSGNDAKVDPKEKPKQQKGAENIWIEFSLTKRSGGELSGAIAELYQGSTMVESWTSTDLSYLTRLQPGTYRFHVKTAPTGFAAPKDFEFTVKEDGSVKLGTIPAGETVTVKGGLITVIFETKAAAAAIAGGTTAQGGKKSNLPKTGDGISPVVYAAAIGVIGAVTLGIGLKKRKEGIDEAK